MRLFATRCNAGQPADAGLSTFCRVLSVALALLSHAVAWADDPEQVIPHAQDRPPGPALSPEEAVSKMVVPPGFTVEIVASEPDIVNPVAMTFDDQGRVWITESLEYPRRDAGPGRDRIKVLEDTNNDGKADKFTIFAEGLNIPSGIAVGHGGVWVANAPDILFLRDNDGDLRADEQEVVVTGFGRDDTHELPNSLTWGPDGWLYGLNGVFNASHVKQGDKEFHFTCALFRIHPKTREFQLFCEGTSNPWGLAFDHEGSAFVSACVIDHLWHLTESGYYQRQGGPYPPFTHILGSIVDHKHQKAAYCGLHYFDSDAYPEEFRNKLYMGNIHGSCINVDSLERAGPTYKAHGHDDLFSANDAWFMPVSQKTGPDGCLYILDWYDRYHCYQDAGRDPEGIDRLKGRLYRLRYADTPRAGKFDLAKALDDQLLAYLSGPNSYYRDTALRILQERESQATTAKLQKLMQDESVDRRARLRSLWALVGQGTLSPQTHLAVLRMEDAGFRAWGVRAAGDQPALTPGVLAAVLKMANDEDPAVRVQVAIAARKMSPALSAQESMQVLMVVLTQSEDPLTAGIVWQNLHPLLEEHSAEFIALVENGSLKAHPQVQALLPRVVERVLGRRSKDLGPVLRLVDLLDNPSPDQQRALVQCLQALLTRGINGELEPAQMELLKTHLDSRLGQWKSLGPGDALGFEALALGTLWQDEACCAAMSAVFAAAEEDPARRLRALSAMVASKDVNLLNAAAGVLSDTSANTKDFRGQVISALAACTEPGLADQLVSAYPNLEPELQPRVIELLTQRASWASALLTAVEAKQIPQQVINVNQVRRMLAFNHADLAAKVTATWGTLRTERNPDRENMVAQMRAFVRDNPGDAVAGEAVFKKVCAQCHKMYGQGQEVGPDITLNGRNSLDQLLSNVFDPSLVIGASYQARALETTDGRILTGLVVEDSPTRVILKTQGGKLETIPRDQINLFEVSKLSMMPEDLEKQITGTEMANLLAYIVLDRPPQDPEARLLPGTRAIEPQQTADAAQFGELISQVAPGFSTQASGIGGVAIVAEHAGRPGVLRTHPVSEGEPCVLSRSMQLPADKKARLIVSAGFDPRGDWLLVVKVNSQIAYESSVSAATTVDGWLEAQVDLSQYAGQTIQLEVLNQASGWVDEHGYFSRLGVYLE